MTNDRSAERSRAFPGVWPWLRCAATLSLIATSAACLPPCTVLAPPPPPPPPPENCLTFAGVESTGCLRNIDCGRGLICEKEDGAAVTDDGCCARAFCEADTECASDERCDGLTAVCVPLQPCDDLGPNAQCDNDSYCAWGPGGSQCSVLPSPATCEIVPPRLVLRDGDPATFSVLGLDDQGRPVYTPALTGLESEIIITDEEVNVTAQCDDAQCAGTLEIEIAGNTTCTADVLVVGNSAGRQIRFFDAQTGTDVVGDVVVVTDVGQTAFADAEGAIELPSAVGLDAITVMAPGYQWRTLVQPPDENLLIPLTKDFLGGSGIVGEVDFADITLRGDVKLGVSGVSIHRPLYTLDLFRIFGREQRLLVDIEGLANGDRSFPTATTLLISAAAVKEQFFALGDPGRHLTWSLGATKTLSNWLDADFLEIGEQTPVTENTMRLLKGLSGAHSGLGGPLVLDDQQPPHDDPLTVDYAQWNPVELNDDPSLSPSLYPHWSIEVVLPGMGRLDGVANMLVMVGRQLPVFGFVPLGLLEMSPDASTEIFFAKGQQSTPGRANVGFSPPHSGIEGGPLIVVVMAFSRVAIQAGHPHPRHIVTVRDVLAGETLTMGSQWFKTRILTYQPSTDQLTLQTATPEDAVMPDVTRVIAKHDGQQWEVVYAGAPEDDSGLRGFLPSDMTGDIVVDDVQSLSLSDDVESFHPLSAPVLLQLDRHVEATHDLLH